MKEELDRLMKQKGFLKFAWNLVDSRDQKLVLNESLKFVIMLDINELRATRDNL